MFYLDFKPLRFFSDCHAQTILGSLTCFAKAPPSRTEYLLLADMDCLTMEICTPKNWNASDPTVVLIHGLCGSDKSNYLQRICKKFYSKGIQTVRVNLRGCGSSRGIARYFYHCGSSDDVLTCLKRVKSLFPLSPISLIGFSLGGNIVLKLAGDLALAGGEIIKQVIAVNPPADLKSCVQTIGRPENLMYERYFIRLLREDVHFRHKRFGLPLINLPKHMSIFEFDEYYIAPQIGYKSALDYYEACSSKRVVDKITVSCQILLAADDPIINTECFDGMNLPENVRVIKTPRGGHLGFLSSPFAPYGARWMDHFILSWVDFINPKLDLGKGA